MSFYSSHIILERSFISFKRQGFNWWDFTERGCSPFRHHRNNSISNIELLSPFYEADFGQAQANVKISEGGYSANPADKGNYVNGVLIGTNWGISAPVLQAFLGRTISAADMQSLPYSTALQIYKSQYWNPLQLDSVNSQSLAYLLYDTAVNLGQGTAKQYVAQSLPSGVYDVNAINSYPDQQGLFNAVKKLREAKYESLGGTFLQGWLNRLNSITFDCVEQKTEAFVKQNMKPLLAIMGAAIVLGITISLLIGGNKQQAPALSPA